MKLWIYFWYTGSFEVLFCFVLSGGQLGAAVGSKGLQKATVMHCRLEVEIETNTTSELAPRRDQERRVMKEPRLRLSHGQ